MRGYQTLILVKERGTLPSRDKSFKKLYKDFKQILPHLSIPGYIMHWLPGFRKKPGNAVKIEVDDL